MVNLVVGVAQFSLLLRHARSLKDKRQVVQSLVTKLRNQGFSVTECAYSDLPKQASIGFAYAARDAGLAERALDEASRLFIGNFEVLHVNRQVFDFTEAEIVDFEKAENEEPDY